MVEQSRHVGIGCGMRYNWSMYYVYILQSKADGTFYIGYSANVDRRLAEHNRGKLHFTKNKKPWEIVYKEEFFAKVEAMARERQIKLMKSRKYIEKLIGK